jgi:hypothetical protein
MQEQPDPPPRQLRLSSVLQHLDDAVAPGADAPVLTLGEVVDRTAHAGFGFLLAFLALISIPFVGLSLPFGLAVAFLAAQMLVGKSHPWLPGFLRRRRVPPGALRWLANKLARFAARVEKLVKPRQRWIVSGPVIGLALVFQGIGLALPLVVPGSNWLFIAPIFIYALGLLEDDGVWVAVGHMATLVQIVLGMIFASAVSAAFERVASWFQ